MTDKELIKQEIKRRLKETNTLIDDTAGTNRGLWLVSNELDEILQFIDSLPEENHFEDKSEMVSEDLEEELHNWMKENCDDNGFFNQLELARHFAACQKQKDQETIELAEDHAMLAGMNKMKEEMMKNIVLETKVMMDCDGDGIETPYKEWLTLENTEIPYIPDNLGLKEGDRVKIIIVKED